MKIVVLDGHTLNPGDLSWDALAAMGQCTVHDRTGPAEILARARLMSAERTGLWAKCLASWPELSAPQLPCTRVRLRVAKSGGP